MNVMCVSPLPRYHDPTTPAHHQVYGKGKSPKIVAFDCGMKYNIVRYFVKHHGVQFTVVPYDYDLKVT